MNVCQWCQAGDHADCPGFVPLTSSPGPTDSRAEVRPLPCACPEERPSHDDFDGDLPPSSDDTGAVAAWRARREASAAEPDPADTIPTE